MALKHALLVIVCSPLLLAAGSCPPSPGADDAQADFFVAAVGQGGVSGYTPQGWGWKPGSKVAIELFNEPNGPGSAATEWKHLFDVSADSNGMFGFSGNAAFYPVRRVICGTPESGQTVVFMAKADTGRIRMRQVPADLYYTFQPCR